MQKLNMIELLYECTVEVNKATKDLFDVKNSFPEGIVNYIHYKQMQQLYENAVLYRLGKEIAGVEYSEDEFYKRVGVLPPNIYSEATLEGDLNDLPIEEFQSDKFKSKMGTATKVIVDSIESVFERHLSKETDKEVLGNFTRMVIGKFNLGNKLN